MAVFFRLQGKGFSLEEMQAHNSDNVIADEPVEGLAAAVGVGELRNYLAPWLFVDMKEHEIVIFRGQKIGDLYDGVLTYPEEIIERVSVDEFFENDRFVDLEEW